MRKDWVQRMTHHYEEVLIEQFHDTCRVILEQPNYWELSTVIFPYSMYVMLWALFRFIFDSKLLMVSLIIFLDDVTWCYDTSSIWSFQFWHPMAHLCQCQWIGSIFASICLWTLGVLLFMGILAYCNSLFLHPGSVYPVCHALIFRI